MYFVKAALKVGKWEWPYHHKLKICMLLVKELKCWKLPRPVTELSQVKFFHPNIGIHFLHNDLSTFPVLMTGRICLTIRSFLNWWSFSLFSSSLHLIKRLYCRENLKASYTKGSNGQPFTPQHFTIINHELVGDT